MAWERPSRGAPKHIRQRVLQRDQHTCQQCGAPGNEVDAKLNDKRGGSHTDLDNLWTLCASCHDVKTYGERVHGLRKSAAYRAARRRLPQQKHPGLR